ncbi:unnamed protein product, partial [Staurois parvus]
FSVEGGDYYCWLPGVSLFPVFKNNLFLEPGCWMESDAQLSLLRIPIGVRLGSDQETYLTLLFFRNATMALDVFFGSLSCLEKCSMTTGTE